MAAPGRARRCDPLAGESHPLARLRDADVEHALALRARGLSFAQIGAALQVSKGAVAKICRGERRSDVAAALSDVDLLPIRRRCTDAPPPLPPRAAGEDAGMRAMTLLVVALSRC